MGPAPKRRNIYISRKIVYIYIENWFVVLVVLYVVGPAERRRLFITSFSLPHVDIESLINRAGFFRPTFFGRSLARLRRRSFLFFIFPFPPHLTRKGAGFFSSTVFLFVCVVGGPVGRGDNIKKYRTAGHGRAMLWRQRPKDNPSPRIGIDSVCHESSQNKVVGLARQETTNTSSSLPPPPPSYIHQLDSIHQCAPDNQFDRVPVFGRIPIVIIWKTFRPEWERDCVVAA